MLLPSHPPARSNAGRVCRPHAHSPRTVQVGARKEQGFPAAPAQRLQDGAFDAFIHASHVTTWASVALMVLAAVLVALRRPKVIRHGGTRADADVPGQPPMPAAAPVVGE